MNDKSRYLYGPVPSRRLGRSYGIDIVPLKVCTLDCVYCQLGRTSERTTERKAYAPVGSILAELKEALADNVEADFITIAGSGEPTLHADLARLIDGIKRVTNIPIALLTNGTLLYRSDVRGDCIKADVIMPSLDAGDEPTFARINRPCGGITIENLISGLCALREEYAGQIWLEVFLIEHINTGAAQIAAIAKAIERIRPDKVHVNTAVRPTAEPGIHRVNAQQLEDIARTLGPNCEVIADFSAVSAAAAAPATSQETFAPHRGADREAAALLSMLRRRPCSLDDICAALSLVPNEAIKQVDTLQKRGLVRTELKDGKTFFKSSP
ncbi:MAG: radical SAM protein [Sedimentisphaerales bacterium]|jgi:wyosine [tRNA(Phe)-imidazoG37] synthetase (radical SAM superfamily)